MFIRQRVRGQGRLSDQCAEPLRNLAATLSRELAGDGVRVGMVSIMGQVASGTPFDPAKIGEAFLRAYYSPANEFKSEVRSRGQRSHGCASRFNLDTSQHHVIEFAYD